MPVDQTRPRVAVLYHFFAHYREPVVRELASSKQYRFSFHGANEDTAGTGIETIDFNGEVEYRECSSWFFRHLLIQPRAISLALSRKTDAIIYLGNPYYPLTWLGAVLARLTGKTVLFWSHGWSHDERSLKNSFRNAFFKLANGILLYSNRAASIGVNNGFPKEKLIVVYNSLDFNGQRKIAASITEQQVTEFKKSVFKNATSPTLLYSGRVTERKRLDLLIAAARQLKSDGMDVNLLIVGDGPELESLKAAAAAANIDLHTTGACYEEKQLCLYFTAANLTVVPDALGLTAIHSLSYGTPVITHDDADTHGPEFEIIVDGETGGLYRRGELSSLVATLKQWLSVANWSENEQVCLDAVASKYTATAQKSAIELALTTIMAPGNRR